MTISKVFKICNAYETGVGHGQKKDGFSDGPYSDPELNDAYEMGYSLGFAISEPHESIVKRIFNLWPKWKREEHQIRVVEKV